MYKRQGSPEFYKNQVLSLRLGQEIQREDILRKLIEIQFERNDLELKRGTFRVRGDVIEILPPSSSDKVIRLELFGDEIDAISEVDRLTGKITGKREHISIYPNTHYATDPETLKTAITAIEEELEEQIAYFKSEDKFLEAQRIEQRTRYDLEMLTEVGFCSGVENYARPLSGRPANSTPDTLLGFFPEDFILFIDESHVAVPQVGGMYAGDRARKENLVKHGFRLPSALDNRPLRFDEFEHLTKQTIYVSATPGKYEKETAMQVVEQVIRPTGLLDPLVEVRPIEGQIDDILDEITETTKKGERVLITTLTKKMAEDLTDYLANFNIKVRYLHSEVKTLERMNIIRDLRLGIFDVLVGINLLREGLDLPEVSLVLILDADKEGFLRSERSMIQTIGRAARNANGRVILYADKITDSMKIAIEETSRRRTLQEAYNQAHGITPKTILKKVAEEIKATQEVSEIPTLTKEVPLDKKGRKLHLETLKRAMKQAAKNLEFELAAELRDEIARLENDNTK